MSINLNIITTQFFWIWKTVKNYILWMYKSRKCEFDDKSTINLIIFCDWIDSRKIQWNSDGRKPLSEIKLKYLSSQCRHMAHSGFRGEWRTSCRRRFYFLTSLLFIEINVDLVTVFHYHSNPSRLMPSHVPAYARPELLPYRLIKFAISHCQEEKIHLTSKMFCWEQLWLI